jgi:dienelactone hydrolase
MAFRGKTPEEARKRQDQMRARLVQLIWPAGKPELPTSFQVISRKDHSDARASYKLYEIWFTAPPKPGAPSTSGKLARVAKRLAERKIHCWLAIPKSARAGRTPAVLCLHGHRGFAQDVVRGQGLYWYGKSLAEKGYVILAPALRHNRWTGGLDYQFGANEGKIWSPTGERVWDCQVCLNYLLQNVHEVDSKRLGVLGLSLGGETATYVGALDQRIGITVASGFLTTMKNMKDNHCGCAVILGFEENFEYSDLFCLIAPRPLVCENSIHEKAGGGFPVRFADEAFKKIEPAYKAFGKRTRSITVTERPRGGSQPAYKGDVTGLDLIQVRHNQTENNGHYFDGRVSIKKLDQVLRPGK